jgi:hypothetical protein
MRDPLGPFPLARDLRDPFIESLGRVWTPLELGASLRLLLHADLGITLNGGTVSAWADQSGQGAHFVQATAANQPLYGTLSGGLAAVVGVDATDHMTCPAATKPASYWRFLHDGSGMTIGMAFETSTATVQTVFSNLRIVSTRSGIDIDYLGGTAQSRILIGNSTATYVSVLTSAGGSSPFGFRRLVYSYSSADNPHVRIRRNGVQIASGNEGAVPSGLNATFDMTLFTVAAGGQNLVGGLRHLVAANRLLTVDELPQLEGYLLG